MRDRDGGCGGHVVVDAGCVVLVVWMPVVWVLVMWMLVVWMLIE